MKLVFVKNHTTIHEWNRDNVPKVGDVLVIHGVFYNCIEVCDVVEDDTAYVKISETVERLWVTQAKRAAMQRPCY